MTTQTVEKPLDLRCNNGGKRPGAGKPKGFKQIKANSKRQTAYYERLSKEKTKIDPLKLTNLLSSKKITISDAAKLLDVTTQSIGQAIKRYKIDISSFDLDAIKNNHESELQIINSIARGRIFDKLLNEEKLGLIELTATLDRSFQQLRELQGKGHSSINIFTLIVQKADENILNVPAKIVDNQQVVQQAIDHTSSSVNQVT